MDPRTISYVLYAWVVVAVALGSALIIFGNTLMATVGAVVIIIGAVSLMPAISYRYWGNEEDEAAESVAPLESTELVEVTDVAEPAEPTDVEDSDATEAS